MNDQMRNSVGADGASGHRTGRTTHIFGTLFGGRQWLSWLLLPACLLLCLLLYFAASAVSERRFEDALRDVETREAEQRENAFYYNRLTAKEQLLYDAVAEAAEKGRSSSEIVPFPADEEMFRNAVNAVLFDRPDLYWIDAASCTLRVSEHTSAVGMVYLPKEDRNASLTAAADAIAAKTEDCADLYERAVRLHDILAERAYAVQTEMQTASGSAFAALYGAERGIPADGFGYAAAYKLLCNAAGIDCEIVAGIVGENAHAWNRLDFDGHICYVDVMWDDSPFPEENIPLHGYFGLTLTEITKDHLPDETFWENGDETLDFYSRSGKKADAETLPDVLRTLLLKARTTEDEYIELLLDGGTEPLESALTEAITAVNGEGSGKPLFRDEFRIIAASEKRNCMAVRLFYESES